MAVNRSSTWSRFANADAAEIASYFRAGGGADHLGYILRMGTQGAIGYALGRAAGMWDANEGEAHSAYTRLAELIRAGATFSAVAA